MSLVLVRIDDRLIHGQVVVGWARHVQADCILVANDAVASDPMQKALLPLAVPQGMEVGIYRVKEAADALHAGDHGARRCILLFASTQDVAAFQAAGGLVPELNLGGLRFAPGKDQVRKAVSLSEDDKAVLARMDAAGLEIFFQMVPGDPKEKFKDVIKMVE